MSKTVINIRPYKETKNNLKILTTIKNLTVNEYINELIDKTIAENKLEKLKN